MKAFGIITTAALTLILGVAAPLYAQEQHDEQKDQKEEPAKPEEKKAQPETKKAEDKKAEEAKPAKQEDKNAQQQEKNNQQEEKNVKQQDQNNKQEEKSAQQQNQNNKQEEKNSQQREQQARAGEQAKRGRIPDDRFRANFGREHTFRVTEGDYRNHRFAYGGYSFGFVGVWPSNWLYTQDVFVVDIDGVYYLCNPTYPGVNLALSFTL
jgi:flagellar motor protein MotB